MIIRNSIRFLKRLTLFCLFYTGVLSMLIRVVTRIWKRHPCIVLTFHRIVDDGEKYLNKSPVVNHRVQDFRKEIGYLKEYFRILGIDEMVDRVKEGSGFKSPSILITFDDGYRDNYVLAYPALKRYGIPATIYLTTGLIGGMERTWPDKIEFALLETREESLQLPGIWDKRTVSIRSAREKEQVHEMITAQLKELTNSERLSILNNIFSSLKIEMKSMNSGKRRMMLQWEEVREMGENNISFGCHTNSHPILSSMPLDEAKKEILVSKEILERRVGEEVKHFAFPNGRDQDFSEDLREYCKEIGLVTVASVSYGPNSGRKEELLSLRRIGAHSPVWFMAGELFWIMCKWHFGTRRDKANPRQAE